MSVQRGARKGGPAYKGHTHTSSDGVVCGIHGKCGDVAAQDGRKAVAK